MDRSHDFPKIRWPIEIQRHQAEGQELLVLSCPLGIAPEPLVLIAGVAPLLACFEGSMSFQQILEKFSPYGISETILKELVLLLDAHLFLASPRFEAARHEVVESFKSSALRPAALAGLGYPASEKELASLVDGLLGRGQGTLTQPGLIGVVAPHIDYRRGGSCYGKTYQLLRAATFDLMMIIGTAHQYSRGIFHLSAKDFATPLGVLPNATDVVSRVAARFGVERGFAEELLHRREHSLELQTPFIRKLVSDVRIIPVLVGTFHHMLVAGKLPHHFEEYESFVDALVTEVRRLRAEGIRLCIVAGVDMAHIGRQFGDAEQISREWLQQVEQRDRIYLEAIMRQDKKTLFEHIAEDGDKRRVCGFPTMYTVIDLFDRLGIRYAAQLVDYQQAVDEARQCTVTFAGLGIYEPTTEDVNLSS